MPKNIVVFSDGTGQEGGKGPQTNVYKLFKMVETRTARQIAYYDRGLGTGWRKISGNALGVGISKNILDCYEFIFEHYEVGDQVFLFGFSRGAYTVRSLAGFISLCRMLPKSRPELIKQAFKIYKIRDEKKRERRMNEFRDMHHSIRCPIKFIGVWDTVRALKIPFKTLEKLNPFKQSFHNHTLNSNIKVGYHALSIDDERLTFHPTFWDERRITSGQTIVQTWFPGVHTDVGGGYVEHGLSDITLKWMEGHAVNHGLLIYHDHHVKYRPDPDGCMHDSRSGFASIFRKKRRKLDDRIVKARIHKSVLDRNLDKHNNANKPYHPWILDHDHDVEQ